MAEAAALLGREAELHGMAPVERLAAMYKGAKREIQSEDETDTKNISAG